MTYYWLPRWLILNWETFDTFKYRLNLWFFVQTGNLVCLIIERYRVVVSLLVLRVKQLRVLWIETKVRKHRIGFQLVPLSQEIVQNSFFLSIVKMLVVLPYRILSRVISSSWCNLSAAGFYCGVLGCSWVVSSLYLRATVSKSTCSHRFSHASIELVSVVLNFQPLHLFKPLNFLDWAEQSAVTPGCPVPEHIFIRHPWRGHAPWPCRWAHYWGFQHRLFVLPLAHFKILSKAFLELLLEIL